MKYNNSYDDNCTAVTQSSSDDSEPARVSKPRRSRPTTSSGRYVSKATSKKPHDAPMQKKDMYFAVDCEMVGVGMGGIDSALARVSVINWNNEIVLDTYVKVEQEVTDYRTFVSGIRPEHIECESAMPLAQVQTLVATILRGKILIGHALENDLKVIGLQHPWSDIRDTAQYAPFMRKISKENDEKIFCPRKLRDLVWEQCGRQIQVIGKAHSPVEDAIAAMDLYKSARNEWEVQKMQEVNRVQQQQQQQQQDAREPMDSVHYRRSPLADRDAGSQLLFSNHAQAQRMPQYVMPMPSMAQHQRQHQSHGYHANSAPAYHYASAPSRGSKLAEKRRADFIARTNVVAALHQQRMRWQQQQHYQQRHPVYAENRIQMRI
jgi:RNA exonuclease 4